MRVQATYPKMTHSYTNRIRAIAGVKPSYKEAIQQLRTVWSLPQDFIEQYLHKYYVRKWDGEALVAAVSETQNGVIIHQNVVYNIQWHGCTPTMAYESDEVMLSFRQVRHEFYHVNYVLISIARN